MPARQDDLNRNSMQLQDLEARVRVLESQVESLTTGLEGRRAKRFIRSYGDSYSRIGEDVQKQ